MSQIEDVIRQLQELAKTRPLKGEAKKKGRQLMSQLRKWGFTNQEIAGLTGGAWSEQQIKQEYTRGAGVEDASVKQRALELLAEVVARSLTLDAVEEAVALSSDLEDRGVSSDEVGALLQQADESDVSTAEMVQFYASAKESGMTVAALVEVRQYKSKLDSAGLTLEWQAAIHRTSKAFGKPGEVLKAVEAYGKVTAIEAQIGKLSTTRKQQEGKIAELTAKTSESQEELDRINGWVELFNRLYKKGFDESTLGLLERTSAKFGGPKALFEAIGAYGNIGDLRSRTAELEKARSEKQTQLSKVEAEYSHLMPVIKTLDTLIYDLKLNPEQINHFYKVAKAYGDPLEVLDAISKYGQVSEIEKKISTLNATKLALDWKIIEQNAQVEQFKQVIVDFRSATAELMKEVKETLDLLAESVATEQRTYAEKLGVLKAEAEQLGEEVKLARAILAADRNPAMLRDISVEYALLLARGIEKLLRVKGVNPTITPTNTGTKYWFYLNDKQFELLDLVEWTQAGLVKLLGK